ncbi:MAG: DUF3783 domain-containing protein [Lachnospiraceae bacterium]|nr:DUF3783 domain-containing protein [Lachnospiraceae bacterium]
MGNSKKVLLFQVNKAKKEQIEALCQDLDIEVVTVEYKQYLEPLGVIAGIQGIPKSGKIYNGMELPMEMMVFSGIHPEFLDVFLKKYREYHIEPIGLKAILTPTNVFWNGEQLYKELLKEHMSFQNK